MSQPSFIYLYILPSLLISPFLTISSNSWFYMWMSMEFNLMTFIPLIIFFNKFYKSLALKYFIVQAFSSSIFIFCSNMMLLNNLNELILMIINFSMIIKLGAAPFHNWYINLSSNLSWLNCLILSTWQKIIPFILLMYIYNFKIILLSALLSSMISPIMGLNHHSIRIILSLSSLNHMGWMLINLMINKNLWLFYFSCYLILLSSIILIFNKFNIFYITEMYYIKQPLLMKLSLLMNFLSLSSLPPMFGFMIKWYSLYYLSFFNLLIFMMFLTLTSSMTFIFYTRICISLLMNFNHMSKINFKESNLFKLNKFMYFNIFSFSFFWMIYFFLI